MTPPRTDEAWLRAAAIELVRRSPWSYTRTELAEALQVRRKDALAIVGRLIAEGAIGPATRRARLRVRSADVDRQQARQVSRESSRRA